MAISLYDLSVRSFLQTLGAVEGFLERGLAHCREAGVDPQAIVEARIHPDMNSFAFQLVSVAHHSRGAIEGAQAGIFSPPPSGDGLGYEALQELVAEASAALQALTPQEVDALEGRDMLFKLGGYTLPFRVEDFLMSFSLPNLHFHATTAYDILRSHGAPLGKRDYMGQLRLKA